MLETFLATLSPMAVVFLCIVIGFISKRLHLVPDDAATVLSKLENYFFVAALIINTFMTYCTVESIKSEYKIILYSIAAQLIGIALSFPLSKLIEKNDSYKRNIYIYALCFANFGFMGNAIVPQILGEEVLYQYMLFTLPFNTACYTWGISILIPQEEKKKSNPLKNLVNPIFISIIIGAFLGLTGLTEHLPQFFKTTVSNLSACMGPLAMILTGFVIGGFDLKALVRNKKVYIATALRLIILPAVLLAILYLLKADKLTLTLALFGLATPLGLNTVVFPAAYGSDASTGASMAMISHTLCVITIPIMYAVLTYLLA